MQDWELSALERRLDRHDDELRELWTTLWGETTRLKERQSNETMTRQLTRIEDLRRSMRAPTKCDGAVTERKRSRRGRRVPRRLLRAGIGGMRREGGEHPNDTAAESRNAELFERICQTLDRYAARMDGHDEALARHNEALDRHNEALDRHNEVLERHIEGMERRDKAFADQLQAMKERDAAFGKQIEAMKERDAVFGRRSDALAVSVIQLQHTAEKWDRTTDALVDAVADLAKQVRALGEANGT
jgi:hypothetical protein